VRRSELTTPSTGPHPTAPPDPRGKRLSARRPARPLGAQHNRLQGTVRALLWTLRALCKVQGLTAGRRGATAVQRGRKAELEGGAGGLGAHITTRAAAVTQVPPVDLETGQATRRRPLAWMPSTPNTRPPCRWRRTAARTLRYSLSPDRQRACGMSSARGSHTGHVGPTPLLALKQVFPPSPSQRTASEPALARNEMLLKPRSRVKCRLLASRAARMDASGAVRPLSRKDGKRTAVSVR
jgi:hypothetical protein